MSMSFVSFTTTGKGHQQHRCQSVPSSSAFAMESNDSMNATEAARDFNTFQKNASSRSFMLTEIKHAILIDLTSFILNGYFVVLAVTCHQSNCVDFLMIG